MIRMESSFLSVTRSTGAAGRVDHSFQGQLRRPGYRERSAIWNPSMVNSLAPMQFMTRVFLFLCLLAAPLFAQSSNPPTFKDARVETYRKVGSTELKLWIIGESDPKAPKPAIVFFHGGGWNSGTPDQFAAHARYFAKRGMIAILAEYRVKSRHGVLAVECVKDSKAAIAWVRENAKRLGIDPNKIAASGGSAGGHLAACTGTITGLGSDERPNAMILFNAATTLAPIGDWKFEDPKMEPGIDRLGVKGHVISPAHHIGPHTPPALLLHGTIDETVPYGSVVAFDKEMKKGNRPCKLIGYEGADHAFFNRPKYLKETIAEADAFLVDLGWIKK